MDLKTIKELDGVEEECDVVGDLNSWFEAYEQGYFAAAWESLRQNAIHASMYGYYYETPSH